MICAAWPLQGLDCVRILTVYSYMSCIRKFCTLQNIENVIETYIFNLKVI